MRKENVQLVKCCRLCINFMLLVLFYIHLQSSSIIKTAKIYDSCIKMSAINLRGATPLARLIKQYGGWSLTGGGMNSWSIEEKMGHVLRDLNVQTLLSVSVRPNLWDSTRNTLAVRLRRYFSFSVVLSDEICFEKTSGICQASEFI